MKAILRKKGPWLLLLAIGLLFLPVAAKAGINDIVTILNTIISTLKTPIGGALSGIQTTTALRGNLQQDVVWPLATLSQTRGFVGALRTRFTGLAGQIYGINLKSATLSSPQQLESLLRSQQISNLANINTSYTNLYQPVPQSSIANTTQRNLVDVDDAFAVGSLKTAVISDQASEQMLTVADNLEQQTATSSPGSAPLLSTQALVANLQSQAFLQRMLAAELRQDAGKLAHSNEVLKQQALAVKNLSDHVQQVLTRQ